MPAPLSLARQHPRRLDIPILVVAAMAALLPGLLLPGVTFRKILTRDTYSILEGIGNFFASGEIVLAIVIFLFSVAFPLAKLVALLFVWFIPLDARRRRAAVIVLTILGKWSMLDAFVIAILLGALRLGILADTEVEPGIYVFAAAILLSLAASFLVDRIVRAAPAARTSAPRVTGRLLSRAGVAVTAAGALCYGAGLLLPLMTIEKWIFWENDYSVLEGTLRMAREGELALAAAVFLFVVLLPLARFAALAALPWIADPPRRLIGWVRLLDEWSMVDVFSLALLVVVVRLSGSRGFSFRPGLWLLFASVVPSIIDSWRLHRLPVREGS